MFGATSTERAYFAPFLAFFAILGLGGLVQTLFDGHAFWMVSSPTYWVYPLQTIVCLGLLIRYWKAYELQWPQGTAFAVGIGVLALIVWVAPQHWFGQQPRTDGFNPEFFGKEGWPYVLNLGMRFFRLVVVVPLIEEIFWKGFLMRYFIREDFLKVPFGTFTAKSCTIVVIGFTLQHQIPDWPASIATGLLFNWVAYRTKSLSACVLTHAVTNALLGFYILRTGQWGFW